VAPGESPFDGACTTDHQKWHTDAPTRLDITDPSILTQFLPENSQVFDFQIQMGKQEYLPGQPSISYLKLANTGSKPISVLDALDPAYSIVKFYVKKDGKETRYIPYVYIDFTPREVQLDPGESIAGRAKIFYGANGYSFPEPGRYQVRAVYDSTSYGTPIEISSNTIDVVIRSPKDKDEEEQVQLIKGEEQALFFLFEGGDHLKEGIDNLTKLSQKYPKSTLGTYANAALGVHWSKGFKDFENSRVRQPDDSMARSYLETATENVKGYWADATYLKLADIYGKAGEKSSMKGVLDDYIGKFEEDSRNTNGVTMARKILNEEL
jgi:hypothetical protein